MKSFKMPKMKISPSGRYQSCGHDAVEFSINDLLLMVYKFYFIKSLMNNALHDVLLYVANSQFTHEHLHADDSIQNVITQLDDFASTIYAQTELAKIDSMNIPKSEYYEICRKYFPIKCKIRDKAQIDATEFMKTLSKDVLA